MDSNVREATVLVVDDDKNVRDFLDKFLKQKGYNSVIMVDSGLKAIDIVKSEEIGLVLLDIKLPEMNGLEVLSKIKEVKKDLNVIMITGFPEETAAKMALKLGAYDYIVKPFDLAYLELCVFSKLSQKKQA